MPFTGPLRGPPRQPYKLMRRLDDASTPFAKRMRTLGHTPCAYGRVDG
jgi:hypothetical protein